MSTSAEYYAKHFSNDDASFMEAKSKCAKICEASQKQAIHTECSATDDKISVHFQGATPYENAFPHLKNNDDYPRGGIHDIPCWARLPTVSLNKRPSSFVGEAQAKLAIKGPCYACLNEATIKQIRTYGMGPDRRFWVGAAAAGAGLTLALLTGLIRRGSR